MPRLPILTLVAAAAFPALACSDSAPEPSTSSSAEALRRHAPPRAIEPYKELVIVHPSIVADPVRTANAADGVWSFRAIMERLAGDGDAVAFVTQWLATFHPQNDADVPAGALIDRPGVDDLIARWPKASDGRIDLAQAPFRLLAITNREDLGTSPGNFGEGRFVFGLVDPATGAGLPMTVIFEFGLPGPVGADPSFDQLWRQLWAQTWHTLGDFPFGDPFYGDVLEGITTAFSASGAELHQLRTNEIALASNPMVTGRPGPTDIWELREWHLGADGQLHAAHVKNTPDGSFDHDPTLAQLILGNASTIADGSIDLAQTPDGAAFLGFESHERFGATRWSFDGVPDPLRGQFAMLTCNGCHNAEQPTLPPLVGGVGFYQVSPLVPPSGATDDTAGQERLSPFMTQTDVARRVAFMQQLLTP